MSCIEPFNPLLTLPLLDHAGLLHTLESGIVVHVRLLNFKTFSHQYFLIPASTFINFNKIAMKIQ